MNFSIYIDDQLGQRLNEVAKASNQSRNALITEAISVWLKVNEKSHWPDEIIQFEGVKDVPSFESHRDDLAPAKDDPFA
jgi:predicted transcriptional regulator